MLYIAFLVGVTRFELATTRPPDAYSNRAELHPESDAKLQTYSDPRNFLTKINTFRNQSG